MSETSSTVEAAEADVTALKNNIAMIVAERAALFERLPALRTVRVEAARTVLLAGGSRKSWEIALRSEQEATAMLADIDAIVSTLERDLVMASLQVEHARREAHMTQLDQRLRRVAAENNFEIAMDTNFRRDVMKAYVWLQGVGRGSLDRKRAHTYWTDRAGGVSLQVFKTAALCHGDIAIEEGGYFTPFGLIEWGGTPAKSLPLNNDPTPAANRALITRAEPIYATRHDQQRASVGFVGRVQ